MTRMVALLGCLVGVAFGQATELPDEADTVALMTSATHNFLVSLSEEQRVQAAYPFDADDRLNYRIAPFPLPGLATADMKPEQITMLHAMLSAGLSAGGYHKVASIMALEAYLVDLEQADGRTSRMHGIDKYRVAVFGTPEIDSTWGWRIHGHHLCLIFTIADGKLYSSGPAFLGAEPHHVTEGPRAGWRILGAEEDLGRALMLSLSEEERTKAIIADEMPADMFSGSERDVVLQRTKQGIAYKDLSPENQDKLRALILEYVSNIPRDVARARLDKVDAGGWENIHFAWIGSIERDERKYYRVQGPEFLIEYCAVALSTNHVHTAWRELNGDFGRDLLGEHMRGSVH